MTVKLIASDMDDTLLSSNTKLSERNAVAIHKAIAKGNCLYDCDGTHVCLRQTIR